LVRSLISIGSGHEPTIVEVLGECERTQGFVTVVAVKKWCGATAVLLGLGVAACTATSFTSPSVTTAPSTAATAMSVVPATGRPGSPAVPPGAATACTYRTVDGQGPLPDPGCTPGGTNPGVTAATVASTICVAGWTSSVRPPESVTEPQKYRSMAAYGDTDSASDYEYDHLIPLELGGASDDTRNLWPQPRGGQWSSSVKDTLENKLRALVCAGQRTLASAQQAIASNWIATYRRYG
jgi:hypothetical protein